MAGDPFKRRRLRVYVAGPISSNPFEGIHAGISWGRRMFLDGLAPFVPHFDAFFFLPEASWNAYLEYDLEFVSVCDAVFRIAGESKGADLEVRTAHELGIPVFYERPPPLWADDTGTWRDYTALLRFAKSCGLEGKRQALADMPNVTAESCSRT